MVIIAAFESGDIYLNDTTSIDFVFILPRTHAARTQDFEVTPENRSAKICKNP